ncbi:hypothetical protein Q760_11065 [Cellulomonas cellasea DSM 20118]|uniref:PBS lyase n=2 Tax=Cellulomonas cellasea TaxID=43670 RepID=A0A0A0BAF4_9CELL|nr:hypothetical protein Q760_11065 [Cellulomonas cellasea DSM 20118]
MLAVGELVQLGSAAVPGLVGVVRDTASVARGLAAEALAEIADPACADDLAAAVGDLDEEVRANAAVGLSRIGDPRAAEALLRTIDDRQDLLHYPYTASVHALIALGAPALPAVATLLDAPDPVTRQRAFVVVRSVVEAMPGTGDWQELWRELGRYEPGAGDQDRAVAQWQAWIASHI